MSTAYTGNNDFAVFGDKVFISFPPFPALLLMPIVKLAGSPEGVRDGLFFLAFAGLGPAVLFLALEKLVRLGRSARTTLENAGLALLFAGQDVEELLIGGGPDLLRARHLFGARHDLDSLEQHRGLAHRGWRNQKHATALAAGAAGACSYPRRSADRGG